jgi:hypothetical protein
MSRGPHQTKEASVRKAVNGAIAAGLEVLRIEIDPNGKISLSTALRVSGADSSAKEVAA